MFPWSTVLWVLWIILLLPQQRHWLHVIPGRKKVSSLVSRWMPWFHSFWTIFSCVHSSDIQPCRLPAVLAGLVRVWWGVWHGLRDISPGAKPASAWPCQRGETWALCNGVCSTPGPINLEKDYWYATGMQLIRVQPLMATVLGSGDANIQSIPNCQCINKTRSRNALRVIKTFKSALI